MKKLLLLLTISFILFLSSCKENLIDKLQPEPSKNLKQAKARLVAVKKWAIDEITINDKLVYSNGQNIDDKTVDVDIEWVRFTNEGVFEIQFIDDGLDTSMRYKLDETKNKLIIYEDQGLDSYIEDWQIETGSVYKDSFVMSHFDTEEDGESFKFTIKLKVLK
jgi:hypothetical protein